MTGVNANATISFDENVDTKPVNTPRKINSLKLSPLANFMILNAKYSKIPVESSEIKI